MRLIFVIVLVLCGLAHAEPVKVDTSTLMHYNLNDLYADYLAEGKLKATTVIDFEDNLKSMWDEKLTRDKGVNGSVIKAAPEVVARYVRKTSPKTSVVPFIKRLDSLALHMRASINWSALCGDSAIDLDPGDCAILKGVAQNIDGKDLLAYSMTELMPGRNGFMNLRVLDVILRNAGVGFFDVVPALYDPMLSFGWYQFTSYALYDDGRERRGASVVCRYSTVKVPASVASLRGDDHHRAAFCFAVYNFAKLIGRMSVEETKRFARLYPHRLDDLMQYMAVAHHGPAPAISAARRWVNAGMKKAEFARSLGPRLLKYAKKTEGNSDAVYAVIKAGALPPVPTKGDRQ